MTTMTTEAITKGAWVEIADGNTNVTITVRKSDTAVIFVGTAEPAGEPTGEGYMEVSAVNPVSLSGLVPADKVYARAAYADAMDITVTKT